MAEFKQFSMAEAAQGAAQIQNIRQNALAMAAAEDRQRQLSPLMSAAAGGDAEAKKQVVAIDPKLGHEIIKATAKMNDDQRNQFKSKIETTARNLQAVMNAPDVYKDQAWQMVKEEMVETLGPDSIKGMPERFDPNWTQLNIDKGLSISDLINARGTAFQPTPAYDKDGNLVFMQGTNIPGKAPTKIEGFKPVDKISTALDIAAGKAEIETGAEADKVVAKGAAQRSQETIDRGRELSRAVPTLKRSIGLLNSVKTGGYQAVALRAKQAFGVEGADEGELSANMGQAVLSDLKETFGAQFTDKEGLRLERIRANFSKSPETNKRLLQQTLEIFEDAANRAIKTAVEQKDYATAQEVQEMLNFEFSFDEQPSSSEQSAAPKSKYQIKVMD